MKNIFTLFISIFLVSTQAQATLTINLLKTDETCGASNGTISIFVSGGLPPYTYLWSNSSLMQNLTGLASGVYTVTVTDSNGDSATGTATVSNSPTILNADLTFIIPGTLGSVTLPCKAQCDGIAYLTESSITGTPPYMISIVSGNPNLQVAFAAGVPAVTNICTGDPFQVLVTDATGCPSNQIGSQIGSAQPSSFNCQQTVTPSCFGGANGAVEILFLSNYFNAPIQISGPGIPIVNTTTTATISNLAPGVYNLLVSYVTLPAGCDTSIIVTIPDLGTNCGVISGKVYLDTISNCTADINEPIVPNQLVRFDPGSFFSTCDANGNYSANLPFNTYSATVISNAPLYSTCSVNGLVLSAAVDTLLNVDLGDSVNVTTDIRAGLTSSAFRPGFTGTLNVTIQNLSIDLIPTPQIDIYYDPQLTFISSTYTPSANVPGHLTFMTNALNPFGYEFIPVYFSTPASVPIGTSFSFSVVASANIPEPNLVNNTDSIQVIVTGSFDPNDKAVANSRDAMNSYYTDLDSEIEYRIRFQNTGTDTAFTVLVVDTLSSALDPSTFHLIAASHPVHWEITGQNVLKFHFNNILLPDSNTNEPESHGAVLFSIEPYVPVLVSSIENRGYIYFDFNPAVLTNTVNSVITTSVGISQVSDRNKLKIVPNPASENITISIPGQSGISGIRVMNSLGQEVISIATELHSQEQVLNVSSLPEGFYIVRIKSEQGEFISSGLVVRH